MTKQNKCFYCTKDEKLQSLMSKICSLQVSTLYLNKDQTHKGRCIIAFHEHKNELFELDDSNLQLFMDDVANAAEALKAVFGANKINYAIYGDLVPHLHFHLVPKYEHDKEWGEAFTNNPNKKQIINVESFEKRVASIYEHLHKTL
ncbi:HIT family protein [Halalkalibacter kiskunsagensis]|uniref:HIT family protein n=1 Tax=Halalkalibacter kiskunsagensis TaxID=1548599 RepID=A0ABV6KDC8_9BACI